MHVSNEFGRVYLPNGVSVAKKSIFSGEKDIWLWRRNGRFIYPKAVKFICFNENYVHLTLYSDVGPSIYSVEEEKLSLNGEPDYDDMLGASKLFDQRGSCDRRQTVAEGASAVE